jgi:outer membrane protein
MKNIVKAIIVSFVIALPSLCFAQKVYKFGHLNSNDIIMAMPEKDSVKVKSDKYFKELQDTYESMTVEYNNKLQKYMGEKDKLTDLIKKTREEELNTAQQRMQEFQQSAQTEMQQKNQELMQPIIEKVKKAITEIGKEGGYTYIFDLATQVQVIVYFSADSQDVTDLVMQKLGLTKNANTTKSAAVPGTKK